MSGALSPEALTELKTLGELRQAGILSPEEFETEKARIMSTGFATVGHHEVTLGSPSEFDDSNSTEEINFETDIEASSDSSRSHLNRGFSNSESIGAWTKLKVAFLDAKNRGPRSLALFLARCYIAVITYGISELILRKMILPRFGRN